jgi:large subunit ribosomal protein L24
VPARIRTDDTVTVVAGKDRGKTGKVLRVDRKKGRVFVEGLNMRKRHQRAQGMGGVQTQTGGVIESEGSIHISNVMLLDPDSQKATRIGVDRTEGAKTRVAKRSKKAID